MDPVAQVILGAPPRRGRVVTPPSVVEGRIKGVSPAGAMFTIPSWDGGKHEFGPAPWPISAVEPGGGEAHDHTGTPPPAGARALVVFVGDGIGNPWIVGWWPS